MVGFLDGSDSGFPETSGFALFLLGDGADIWRGVLCVSGVEKDLFLASLQRNISIAAPV